MKVYIVLEHYYDQTTILVVFPVAEMAEDFINDEANIKKYYKLDWDEWDVDELP